MSEMDESNTGGFFSIYKIGLIRFSDFLTIYYK